MILITDAEMKSSLPFIRSFGKRGHTIHVTSSTRIASGAFSKYAKFVKHPRYEDYEFIVPISDQSNEFFVGKNYNTLLPNKEDYNIARDKKRTIELAEKTGVPHPKTVNITDPHKLSFPIITKPRKSSGSRGVCLSLNEKDFIHNTEGKEDIILQEFIPYGGKNYCVDMIYKNNKLVALYMSKIHRTYPVHAGPDILTETFYDAHLKKLALQLMSGLRWNGIINLEFKSDPRDGEYKLMEVNPRPSGSIGLSIKSGIDFPELLYKAFKGENFKNFQYTLGTKYTNTYDYLLSLFQDPTTKIKECFTESLIDTDDIIPHLIELTYPFNRTINNKGYLKRTNKTSRKNMKLLNN